MPKHYTRGIGGAVIGAVLGVLLYWAFLRRGIQVPLLAPALTGVGAGLAVGRRAWGMGAIAAVMAVVVAVLADASCPSWRTRASSTSSPICTSSRRSTSPACPCP